MGKPKKNKGNMGGARPGSGRKNGTLLVGVVRDFTGRGT